MRLPPWSISRVRHWKAVLWRPALRVWGSLFALVSFVSLVRAETTWIPSPWRDLPIVRWLPVWPWTTWALGAMILLLVVVLEGSYRLVGRDGNHHQDVLDALSEFRVKAVSLLNEWPQGKDACHKWLTRETEWRREVVGVLSAHYPKSTRLRFETLGLFEQRGLPNWGNQAQQVELENLAERVAVLDAIMDGTYGVPR